MIKIPVRLNIVVAPPGARGDFLAGWLGTLCNAIDTDWRIDAATGRSFGSMNLIKAELSNFENYDLTLTQILSNVGYELSVDADTVLTVSCHQIDVDFSPSEIAAIKIIQVTTDRTDCEKCNWEFIVKTFLCKERFESSYQSGSLWNVDKELEARGLDKTNQNRVLYIKKIIWHIKNETNRFDGNIDQLSPLKLPYKELLSPNGSYSVSNLLQINPSQLHHKLWKTNLEMASSQDRYTIFDHVWDRNTYWA
jgi:hypothetical protein